MGTNIHGMIEIKDLQFKDSWFGLVDIEFIGRNYYLFYVLGLNNHETENLKLERIPISRGVPRDCSQQIENKIYTYNSYFGKTIMNDDWHSFAYFNPLDLIRYNVSLCVTSKKDKIYIFINILKKLIHKFGSENVRVIIYFDN